MQGGSGSSSLHVTASHSDQCFVPENDSTTVQLWCTVQLLSLQHCTGCTCNEGKVINIVNSRELLFQNHPFRSILHKCPNRT